MSLKTYTHFPLGGAAPESMVILLHGLGANGMDLIGLARHWETLLPKTVFLSPDAPFPCDMAPVGFQWFSLQEWSAESILAGVKEAAPFLIQYIQAMLDHYNIKPEKLALAGFSQGTMMSLYVAPRLPYKIAGVLGYSGALIRDEEGEEGGLHQMPVHLIHGESDTIVPVSAYHHARTALQTAGFDVSGHTTPGLPHGIDEDGIESGGQFLNRVLI